MKAKTKFQRRVVSANERMQPITARQSEWAISNIAPHFSFRTKGKDNTCSDCGYSFFYDRTSKVCRCPNCGRLLTVEDSRKTKFEYKNSFSIFNVVGDFQVQRIYHLFSCYKKGHAADHQIIEMVRIWHDIKGNRAVCARLRHPFSKYLDSFCLSSDIELRKDSFDYSCIADTRVVPYAAIHHEFKKRGVSRRSMEQVNPDDLLTHIANPHIETIMKLGRMKHLKYFLIHPGKLEKYWKTYRITIRRKYEVGDIAKWIELVDALRYCGKDDTNACYVCPEDFTRTYNHWLKKMNALKAEKRLQEEKEKAHLMEVMYRVRKSKYFDLVITDGEIVITVLDSVRAFIEEGEFMHHCVFANKYHEKEDSLVLSARINGERIETVEILLSSMRVNQCYAVCNGKSKYHDRILNLVNSNIGMIESRYTA